jgi:hypothetical protein
MGIRDWSALLSTRRSISPSSAHPVFMLCHPSIAAERTWTSQTNETVGGRHNDQLSKQSENESEYIELDHRFMNIITGIFVIRNHLDGVMSVTIRELQMKIPNKVSQSLEIPSPRRRFKPSFPLLFPFVRESVTTEMNPALLDLRLCHSCTIAYL